MRRNILVIDDELPLCDFLAFYLTMHGFLVTTTTRGAAALRLLDENHYHLVVLDVVLKDGDGLELLSEIKNTHSQLPVLLLTGLGFQDDVLLAARQRGADGYLSKAMMTTHLVPEICRLVIPPAGKGNRMAARAAEFFRAQRS